MTYISLKVIRDLSLATKYAQKVAESPIVIISDIDEAKDGNVSLIDIRGKCKDVGIVVWDLKGNRFYIEWSGFLSDIKSIWWDEVRDRRRTPEESINEFRCVVGSLTLNLCEVYHGEREDRYYSKHR